MNFSIFYPFYLCIFFSFLAGLYILLSWNENNFELLKYTEDKSDVEKGFWARISAAYEVMIADKPLMAVGIIESAFKISLTLFSFMWTPLLEETSGGLIHPGAIFVCFMLARLIGSEIFEGSKKILKTNTYVLSIFITVTGALSFWLEYSLKSFQMRLLMLIYFDGLSGIFMPLMSSLKSQMIQERMRTTIMTFFRLPINLFCIIILFVTRYLTTTQICAIAFFTMLIACVTNVLLFMWHTPPDATKRTIIKSTKLKSSKNVVDLDK